MAIKKSELYRTLWKSCDELRGSMSASQYKDYVLVLLFMKYVSDKKGDLVDIPEGGSFKDMVKLKGKSDIGNQMNIIIGNLAEENVLNGIITIADFNDDDKLGKGQEKIDRLSNLIEIFENEALDFSGNRIEDDDLLGDAYEYLMRHFATESGKSKGQFYTPAEVSRIIAQVISIENAKSPSESIYDPTCGSGSLLLRAAAQAPYDISIYGQEMDNATRALAVMNMWLHGHPDAEIVQGNTLVSQRNYLDDTTGELKRFNYVVANPPFSNKAWSSGLDPANDIFKRFQSFGTPPAKNGDYAFLLHLIKVMKSKAKAAIILPLGVLFRGNVEATIRKKIIKRGYIKGIIGLPPNLFYGTGIAACIIVLDKEKSGQREDIFMIDASKDFMKDGNKNRLRSRDIHKIVDVFNKRLEIANYSRLVPLSEIADPKNDYNLNIPRYIDSQEEEDIQDIEAHLLGGLPKRDIQALDAYWQVYPTLKSTLLSPSDRPSYWTLSIPKADIKTAIFEHPEFIAYSNTIQTVYQTWQNKNGPPLKKLEQECHPKTIIKTLSDDILHTYQNKALLDKYAIYQHLLDYWDETLQDDLYEISAEGWQAGNEVIRLIKKSKKGRKTIEKKIDGLKGLAGRLIPTDLIIETYFAPEQTALHTLETKVEDTQAEMEALREEHGGEEGLLADVMDDKQRLSKKALTTRLKELGQKDDENAEEWDILSQYKKLMTQESTLKGDIKKALLELETKVIEKYPTLSLDEIKSLTVDKKWLATLESRINTELEAISHRLTERLKELAERYETPLPDLTHTVATLSTTVEKHLQKMGYTW